MIEVRNESVRENGPVCRDGTRSMVIGETGEVIYRGENRQEAVKALMALGIGFSVSVRHPQGIRSCMNKPALWNDVLSY